MDLIDFIYSQKKEIQQIRFPLLEKQMEFLDEKFKEDKFFGNNDLLIVTLYFQMRSDYFLEIDSPLETLEDLSFVFSNYDWKKGGWLEEYFRLVLWNFYYVEFNEGLKEVLENIQKIDLKRDAISLDQIKFFSLVTAFEDGFYEKGLLIARDLNESLPYSEENFLLESFLMELGSLSILLNTDLSDINLQKSLKRYMGGRKILPDNSLDSFVNYRIFRGYLCESYSKKEFRFETGPSAIFAFRCGTSLDNNRTGALVKDEDIDYLMDQIMLNNFFQSRSKESLIDFTHEIINYFNKLIPLTNKEDIERLDLPLYRLMCFVPLAIGGQLDPENPLEMALLEELFSIYMVVRGWSSELEISSNEDALIVMKELTNSITLMSSFPFEIYSKHENQIQEWISDSGDDLESYLPKRMDRSNPLFVFRGSRDNSLDRTLMGDLFLMILYAINDAEDPGKEMMDFVDLFMSSVPNIRSSTLSNTFKIASLKRNASSDEEIESITLFEQELSSYRKNQDSYNPELSRLKSQLNEIDLQEAKLIQSWKKIKEKYDYKDPLLDSDLGLWSYVDLLDSNEELISFFIHGESSIVVHAGTESAWALPISSETEISSLVKAYRNEIVNGDKYNYNDEYSRELYQILFKQILSTIPEAESEKPKILYIIPDNVLSTIPLSALKNEDGRWLGELYDIRILNSEKDLLNKRAFDYKELNKFVGFADPYFQNTSKLSNSNIDFKKRGILPDGVHQRFAELPETLEEIKQISTVFPQKILFTGKDASEENIKKGALYDADLIVFSTHAIKEGELLDYEESGILLSKPEIPTIEDDGYLTPSEILTLKVDRPVVILSACNTASSSGYQGDIYSGLANSFFRIGATDVIVSHWSVESLSTRILITNTIKEVQRSRIHISDALAKTKMAMAEGKYGDLYKHPFFWSAFVSLSN